MTVLQISNPIARALWLETQGLGRAPTGALDVMAIIRDLGFVQLDTIQVVSRAHHHILWSRNQNYREPMLDQCLGQDRAIFEHFTHDASVLPMAFLPMWQRQFRRKKAELDRSNWYKDLPGAKVRRDIKARIAAEGPLSTHAFDTRVEGPKQMWARPPHKLALDYMWYAGDLATSHRMNFAKYYDLAERVFPEALRQVEVADQDQIDWLCDGALSRLGCASLGEVQRFWAACSAAEVRAWAKRRARVLRPVRVQSADGTWRDAFAPEDIEARLAALSPPTSRLRILNPFDPAIRDRARAERLFGFAYRVEMFVPEAKRLWGYYVYPILEGSRFVGRIEVKADRKTGVLHVQKLWFEPGVVWPAARMAKLEAELARLQRFVGLETCAWEAGAIRAAPLA